AAAERRRLVRRPVREDLPETLDGAAVGVDGKGEGRAGSHGSRHYIVGSRRPPPVLEWASVDDDALPLLRGNGRPAPPPRGRTPVPSMRPLRDSLSSPGSLRGGDRADLPGGSRGDLPPRRGDRRGVREAGRGAVPAGARRRRARLRAGTERARDR